MLSAVQGVHMNIACKSLEPLVRLLSILTMNDKWQGCGALQQTMCSPGVLEHMHVGGHQVAPAPSSAQGMHMHAACEHHGSSDRLL